MLAVPAVAAIDGEFCFEPPAPPPPGVPLAFTVPVPPAPPEYSLSVASILEFT